MNKYVDLNKFGDFEPVNVQSLVLNKFHTEDLDFHAKLFDSIELEAVQLSPGAFKGSLFFALVDKLSFHVSHCAQALEKRIEVHPDKFMFCICLCEDCSKAILGITDTEPWIYVLPPGGKAVATTSVDCSLLIMTVDCEELLTHGNLTPEVRNWFHKLRRDGEFVRSARLTHRIREDAFLTIQSVKGVDSANQSRTIKVVHQAMMSSISTCFSLEWLERGEFAVIHRSPALERFLKARNLIAEHAVNLGHDISQALSKLGSKRSLEQAFALHTNMGPRSYARIIRLHKARRKLRDERYRDESIGNIAAQEGFWDWSRFTGYYSKHFGELPSETREKSTTQSPN